MNAQGLQTLDPEVLAQQPTAVPSLGKMLLWGGLAVGALAAAWYTGNISGLKEGYEDGSGESYEEAEERYNEEQEEENEEEEETEPGEPEGKE